jgi:hypothetical protein
MHKANQFSMFSSQFYCKRVSLMCCMRCSIIMSGLCSPTQDTLAMEVRSYWIEESVPKRVNWLARPSPYSSRSERLLIPIYSAGNSVGNSIGNNNNNRQQARQSDRSEAPFLLVLFSFSFLSCSSSFSKSFPRRRILSLSPGLS